MSLHFALIRFYRLAVDDLVIMYDAYSFYSKLKPKGKSIKEFSEVLENLIDVEAQNFEDIDESKLSHGDEGSVSHIAWDYLINVILKYLLDDLSQYPFWRTKVIIATSNESFGIPVIKHYFQELHHLLTNGSMSYSCQGLIPFLTATFIGNFPYLVKTTYSFILTIWAKIPRPPSIPEDVGKTELNTLSSLASSHNLGKVKLPASSATTKAKKVKSSAFHDALTRGVVSVLSHPFLVIAVRMVVDPIYAGRSWLYAYYRIVSDHGIRALYGGLRTRLMFNMMPVSPFVFWGINDSLVYRRILGQGSFDTTGGLLSVAREITDKEHGSALTLFNNGLLTAVHAIPGFLAFLGVRCISSLIFGSSIHRKDQIARRREIVEAHMIQLKKRSASTK